MTQPFPDTCAAFLGIDWAEAHHDGGLQAAGTANRECFQREHTPEAMDAWVTTLRTRFHGQPVAVCRARTTGPLVSAWRTSDFLVLFPIHPLMLAQYRDAFTPSRATDDPTDAALPLALLLTPRDTLRPRTPQRPTMRALPPRVAHRRRVVGDTVRITQRRTRPLKNSCPHVLHGLQDQDTPLFCAFLRRWPTLRAMQRARRATLATCFRDHHVRSAAVMAQRLQAITAAPPLTTDDGVIAPNALLGQALVAQLRVTVPASADVATAIAPRAQRHPDCPLFQALPGAGPVFAPRLLVAVGAHRDRSAAAAALQKYAGSAPLTERRGKNSWVPWRLPCPQCRRQTFVEGAAESSRHSCWAQVSYQQQRDKGSPHQATVRALAFTGIRILYRGGQERTAYDASISLRALNRRGASLLHPLAQEA